MGRRIGRKVLLERLVVMSAEIMRFGMNFPMAADHCDRGRRASATGCQQDRKQNRARSGSDKHIRASEHRPPWLIRRRQVYREPVYVPMYVIVRRVRSQK